MIPIKHPITPSLGLAVLASISLVTPALAVATIYDRGPLGGAGSIGYAIC
jgi:hypothetical protein